MKLLNPTPEPASPAVTIDFSKPIIEFDPWPFRESVVHITQDTHYFLGLEGTLEPRLKGAVSSCIHPDSFLAVATDGHTVIGKVHTLKSLGWV